MQAFCERGNPHRCSRVRKGSVRFSGFAILCAFVLVLAACGGNASRLVSTPHTQVERGAANVGNNENAAPGCPQIVAVLAPVPGEHCHDSVSGLKENVPASTSDTAHEVVNISTLTFASNDGTQAYITGYVYTDSNGQLWLGGSPSYHGSIWSQMTSSIPVIGTWIQAVSQYGNSVDQLITATQLQQIKTYPIAQGPSGKVTSQPCFTKALTIT